MSLPRKKTVSQLVKKYRAKYPELEREILRKLIRLENPELFSREKTRNPSSNLRNLDRHLGKAFKNAEPKTAEKAEPLKEQIEREKLSPTTVQALAGCNEPFYFRRLPDKSKPIYVPQVKPRRLPEHIPNPDEIDEANRSQKEKK